MNRKRWPLLSENNRLKGLIGANMPAVAAAASSEIECSCRSWTNSVDGEACPLEMPSTRPQLCRRMRPSNRPSEAMRAFLFDMERELHVACFHSDHREIE